MENSQELTFIGRLTKEELISLDLDRLMRKPAKEYIAFGFIGIALALVFSHIQPQPGDENNLKWFSMFLAVCGVVTLMHYASAVAIIYLKTKEQNQDTTVRMAQDKVIVEREGFSATWPANKFYIGKHRLGIAAFLTEGGVTLFVLPYRILSKEQITAIEQMYNLNNLGPLP